MKPLVIALVIGGIGLGIARPSEASEVRHISEPEVSDRNAHDQKWMYNITVRDDNGSEQTITGGYTEVATGLNKWDENVQAWVPANPIIEIVNGKGVIRNTQHQGILAGNANDPDGLVDLMSGGGERLRIRTVGLVLTDKQNGISVVIAEVKDADGFVAGDGTVVIYPDAFDDIKASIQVKSHLTGIESDVVIEQTITRTFVESWGIDPDSARLEVWHEVIQAPGGTRHLDFIRRQAGDEDEDHQIHFSATMIGRGNAFFIGTGEGITRTNKEPKTEIPVAKEWIQLEGKHYLIEGIPFAEAEAELAALPPGLEANLKRNPILKSIARQRRGEQSEAFAAVNRVEKDPRSFAGLTINRNLKVPAGYVIDYVTLSTSQNNYTFKGDETYLISGEVILNGTNTVFEGGSVLKFTSSANARLKVNSPITWLGTQYRNVTFTARDDNSIGQIITPSGTLSGYYADVALYIDCSTNNPSQIEHLRVSHAKTGVYYHKGAGHNLSHVQMVNCQNGIKADNAEFNLRNALMYNVLTNFTQVTASTGRCEHVTINTANSFNNNVTLLAVTNSILCGVTSAGPYTGNSVSSYGSASGVFETVLAGAHYLPVQSADRNSGTMNISPRLLKDLRSRTTDAPILLSNSFNSDTTLYPQAARAVTLPVSRGYHYDPLDYIWTSLTVASGTTLTLTNGVAVGSYGARLLTLSGTGAMVSQGMPTRLNRVVTYHTVQEQPGVWIPNMSHTLVNGYRINLRFTDISLLAAPTAGRTFIPSGPFATTITIHDSQLRGVYWYAYNYSSSGVNNQAIRLTNNVLERVTAAWAQTYYGAGNFSSTLQNNLFSKCTLNFTYDSYYYGYWDVFDNLFDSCSFNISDPNYSLTSINYNAFANCSNPFYSGGSSNKTGFARDFVAGPLGSYYYPENTASASLGSLTDGGSKTNAGRVGLYQYTTKRSQEKDGATRLDIGHHYPSVAKVRFIGTDSATQGNWKGTYGSEGFNIIQDSFSYPSFATVTPTGNASWTWSSSSSDVRALQKAGTGRIAGTWFTGSSYSIALSQNDPGPHRIAFYLLDWDSNVRSQKIEFKDPVNGAVYDTRVAANYNGGIYYIWEVIGDVTIVITNLTGGANAVISGIFFDHGTATPTDVDADGIYDYAEDANGTGTTDTGEVPWNSSQTGVAGEASFSIFTPLHN